MAIVSVIIVNYNSGMHLPRCLDSLQAQTWQDFEVIVVDNTSTDSSMAYLDTYPGVRRADNSVNKGFAAGQNQGIALSKGQYILALNYDLVMMPNFLERLVSAMESHPEAGWACGKLLNMDRDGTLTNTIYAVGHLLPPERFPRLRGNGEVNCGQYDNTEYVFGAPGAAALYRREMIEAISFGGQFFDESFFTWYEDVDVDWRAQNRGWKCLYVPDAVAYHQGHVGEEYAEPFRSFRAEMTIRNRWLMIMTNERKGHLISMPLLRYEFSLLVYVIRSGLLISYLKAWVACVRSSFSVARKRNLVSQQV